MAVSSGQYVYSHEPECINVGPCVSSSTKLSVGGTTAELYQMTQCPYEGTITITVRPEKPTPFMTGFRIPGQCGGRYTYLDGNPISPIVRNGHLELVQVQLGNVIELKTGMTLMLYEANPKMRVGVGHAAIGRGPLIYCPEEIDNGPNL